MHLRCGVVLFIGWVMLAALAQAGACTIDSLDHYIANFPNGPGNGCTAGPLEYTNFFFQTTGNITDTAGNINVVPGGQALNFFGFKTLQQNAGNINYFIGFDVDPAPVLTGDSIFLDPPVGGVTLDLFTCLPDTPYFVGGSGNVGDTNLYCGASLTYDPANAVAINLSAPNATIVNNGQPAQTASFTFPVSTSQAGILLRLSLQTSQNSPTASLDSIANDLILGRSGGVPEPATWSLLGLGLIGAAMLKRARSKRLS